MLASPSTQNCQLFGKSLKKVKELGFGRNGVAVLVEDTAGKQYVLKYSHNGYINENEYKINQRLDRAYGYQRNVPVPFENNYNASHPKCDALLIEYLPGYEKDDHSGFVTHREKNLLKALRMMESLENLLNKGVCQYDVKLCNFVCFEKNNDFKVDVIDFGNAKIVEQPSLDERKEYEEHLVASLMEQACFEHDWAEAILKQEDYDSFKDLKSIQDAKIQLRKLLAKENSSRNYSQVPAAPVVQPAPVVLMRNQNTPQGDLEYCVDKGLQKGVLKALAQGAQLTREIIAKLDDAAYKLINPKTHQVIAQTYLENSIKQGLQIGAVRALKHGAELTPTMINKLNDSAYQRENPKMMLAMMPYIQNRQSTRGQLFA